MDLITPNFKRNIYSLGCGISEFLDVERQCLSKIELSGKKLALILLDGFGWSTMVKAGINVKEAEKIQTVFPSITTTVLTTLFTAQTPGEHGVIGYTVFVKEMGGVINTLPYFKLKDSRVDLIRPVFSNARSYISEVQEKRTIGIIPREFERLELGFPTHGKMTELRTYLNDWDAIYIFSKILQGNYDFVYLYVPTIDALSHKYGPNDDLTLRVAREIFESLYSIAKKRPEYTVVITADHGHVQVGGSVDLRKERELMKVLEVPPYGDVRALFFKSRYDIREYLAKYNVKMFTKREITSLLGRVGSNLDLPDYVAVPLDSTMYKIYDDEETYTGQHGGLLDEEFEIPLVIING